jgi:hypothetical protein
LVALLAAACGTTVSLTQTPDRPTATPATPITRAQAIDIASLACRIPHLVLVGTPRNIRAQLVTLDQANQLTSSGGTLARPGLSSGSPVWLVQMDGQLQLVGGPLPIRRTQPSPPRRPRHFRALARH